MKPVIIISLDEKGAVHIQAPLDNKIFCFGVLEIAKQIVINAVPKEEPKIVPANIFQMPKPPN